MNEEEYDIVLTTLQEKRDRLWKMNQQNMNADMFNIMDQIRLEQIDELDRAMLSWKKSKE
jgi:hypothetical protein